MTKRKEGVIINLHKCKKGKEGGDILINKPKLIYYCSMNHKSLKDLARELEMNQVTLYRKIRGDSDFYRHEIIKIKEILDLSTNEINEIFFSPKLA